MVEKLPEEEEDYDVDVDDDDDDNIHYNNDIEKNRENSKKWNLKRMKKMKGKWKKNPQKRRKIIRKAKKWICRSDIQFIMLIKEEV